MGQRDPSYVQRVPSGSSDQAAALGESVHEEPEENTLGGHRPGSHPPPFCHHGTPTNRASLGCPSPSGKWAFTRLSGLSGVGNPTVISRGRGLARGAARVLYQGVSAVTERARALLSLEQGALLCSPSRALKRPCGAGGTGRGGGGSWGWGVV